MSETEYCRLCDSPIASAYDSYCKAHDAEDEIIQLERQLEEAREYLIQASEADWTEELNDYVKQLKEKG
jgi:hypothetical protein